jgi:hypothetical protein
MSTRGITRAALVALVALSASAGCAFSSYHTAKMLPQGATRVGGGISFYSLQADDGSGDTQGYELMASHGLSDKVELGGKLVLVTEEEMGERVTFYNLFASPKVSVVPDTVAFTAESGIILATGSDDTENIWQTMPGIVFTHTFNEMFALNLAGKAVLQFSDNFDDHNVAVATNIGFGILIPDSKVTLFPELGFMYDDDQDEGYFMQFGFAVHYEFGGAPAPAPMPMAPTAPVAPPPPVEPAPPPPPVEPAPPPPVEPAPAP